MQGIVKLLVGNRLYAGWKTIKVNDSLRSSCASFQLGVTERWQTEDERDLIWQRWKIRAGDACQVYIDDDVVITGYVDVHNTSISDSSHDVNLSGRSLAGDLVDCAVAHSPGNFVNQSVLSIARAIADPFSVSVEVGESVNSSIIVDKFEINNSETAFQAIDRLARKYQLLVTSSPLGKLILERANPISSGDVLRGWKKAELTVDHSQRFSHYIGKSQQHGYDVNDPLLASQVNAEIRDKAIARYRPKIVRAEGSSNLPDLQKRIKWQSNRDLAKSIKLQCTMEGYRNERGQLWAKNQRYWVKDDVLGVDNEMLIESVVFSKANQSGSVSELSLVHPSVFEPEPVALSAVASSGLGENSAGYLDLV